MNIAVAGLGYVGLVAAACLARSGHVVVGVDKDQAKLAALETGRLPIYEEGLQEIVEAQLRGGRLRITPDLPAAVSEAEVLIVAVGTPSLPDGRVDLSQVYSVLDQVVDLAHDELTVVMKSTVPPGTGRKITGQLFAKSRAPIRYASNPEFLREGKAVWDWYHPDRIVVGADSEATARKVLELYADIQAPKLVMDITSAEMVKYASNALLATKISFINEIANLCELVGANIDMVAPAVGLDARIGPHFLQAGLGYGGSCFPKDTKALDQVSSLNGYRFGLLKSVIEVNSRQRVAAVKKLREGLGSLYGRRIAILGLAFKPGTDDVREAPALEVARYLVDEGAVVAATDPVAAANARSHLPVSVFISADPYEVVTGAEALLLATEWPQLVSLDWEKVRGLMVYPYLVVDGRNALDYEGLVQLGFRYCGFGRPSAPIPI